MRHKGFVHIFGAAVACALAFLAGGAVHGEQYAVEVTADGVEIRGPAGPMAVYRRTVPEDVALTVDSGGFFHPFNTPAGTPVTGLRPEDHLYHRGVFFAWFEMLGDVPADFWGWGEHAPVEDRVIVSRAIPEVSASDTGASFTAENEWNAGGEVMVNERLSAHAWTEDGAHVLDLEYTVVPTQDITLPQRAFSGFCFRTRIDGGFQPFSPEGPVDRDLPSHVDPDSNWPPQPWYAYTIDIDGVDQPAGAAVVDHPDNPESLWHNQMAIGMLNPVIMALDDVELPAGEPFVLRYHAVTFDGEVPEDLLNRLAEDW